MGGRGRSLGRTAGLCDGMDAVVDTSTDRTTAEKGRDGARSSCMRSPSESRRPPEEKVETSVFFLGTYDMENAGVVGYHGKFARRATLRIQHNLLDKKHGYHLQGWAKILFPGLVNF